jgi:hypothetical protein
MKKSKWIVVIRSWIGASKKGLMVSGVKRRWSRKQLMSLDAAPGGVVDFLGASKLKSKWVMPEFKSIQELKDGIVHGKILSSSGVEAKVEFEVEERPPAVEIEKLTWGGLDGSHWGLGDWYKDLESAISQATKRGKKYAWTTGWYGSKKEIASANITHIGGEIEVEVSVSDDLDTEGIGSVSIKHTRDLDEIRDAIDKAWEMATENQKDNAVYVGYSVLKGGAWVETYIRSIGDPVFGCTYDTPPGDCYHQWGWQGEGDIPEETKKKIEEWIVYNYDGSCKIDGYTIKAWDGE